MTSHLVFLALGLGAGAALAMLSLGLVVTYRASGVVNIAHAAVGMYLGFVFYEFRETGDIVLPIVGLPARVHLFARPTLASALIIVGVYAAGIGALLYAGIFRRLRHAPPLAGVVASIGVFLYAWAMVTLRFPAAPRTRAILPTGAVRLFGRALFTDRLASATIALAVTGTLVVIYRRTRFGLATTASAENATGAALTGVNPDLLSIVNWMLATVLGALAMIIVAPVAGLDPLQLSLLVVPALAAAMVGDFTSLAVAAAAGFVIGMAQSEIVNLQAEWRSLSGIGIAQLLPFLVIVVLLAVRGRALPERGERASMSLPASPPPRHPVEWSVALAAVAIVAMSLGGSEMRSGLITSAIAVVLSLSVVVLTGFVGQVSLAPFAFAGVAAFTVARTTSTGWPFLPAAIVSIGLAVGLGVLLGLPALRVRGMSLAIATLGAAVVIEQSLFKWRWFVDAGSDVAQPRLFGIDLGIAAVGDDYPRRAFGIICVVLAAVAAVLTSWLRGGATGRAWMAVRSDESAAAAAGVDVTRAKLGAFALSSAFAAVAGVLLAVQRQSVSVDSFATFASLALVAITYLAGISAVSGAAIAGALAPLGILTVIAGQDPTRVSPYAYVINAVLLVLAALAMPDGLAPTAIGRWRRTGAATASGTPGSLEPRELVDEI